MKRKLIMMGFGIILMISTAFAYEWVMTLYADERQNEQIQAYCTAEGIPFDDACRLQYFQENLDDDTSDKVIDDINTLSDLCYDPNYYEFCRLGRDNLNQIFQITAQGTVYFECRVGEQAEWTTTHCLGLTETNTRCQQSGFTDTIYIDCAIAWVQI